MSTGAAAASGTALSREGEEQQRLPRSTGLRAGDDRAATKEPGESQETLPPPTGLAPREQPPSPPLPRETTGYIPAGRSKEGVTVSLVPRDGREA